MITNAEWQDIERKLHDAVGQKLDVSRINIIRSNHVEWWLEQDYDLDLDIIPAIKQFMVKFSGDRVVSWKLFDPYIKQHHRQRMFRKSRSSSFADSKGFQREDVPLEDRETRKRGRAMWEQVKKEMNNG